MAKPFRETLWFKKGELDAKAAEQAAGEEEMLDAADLLPVEDRYLEDGSVSAADRDAFSVRTGGTQMVPLAKERGPVDEVGVAVSVAEMKRGRRAVLAMIAGSVAAVVAIAIVFIS